MSSLDQEYAALRREKLQTGRVDERRLQLLIEKTRDLDPSESVQRLRWWQLRTSIERIIANCTTDNIQESVLGLFHQNLHRGRGVVVRELMGQYYARPGPVYGAIAGVLNSKLPEIGELLANRLVVQFKRAYVRKDLRLLDSALGFICDLVVQDVMDDIVLLQIFDVLLERPSTTTIDLSVQMLVHTGAHFFDRASLNVVFDRLRTLLTEHKLAPASQRAIKRVFEMRRRFPKLDKALDLVEEEDKNEHFVDLDGEHELDTNSNFFSFDDNWAETEAKYQQFLLQEIDGEDSDDEEDIHEEVAELRDMTQSNLLQYQKTIYLNIMASMSSDEAVHKLVKLHEQSEHEDAVLVDMIVRSCSQEKTYSKYFGVIGEKLSRRPRWHGAFVSEFKRYYTNIHQFENNQLRNIGKFFGHLFATDSLSIEHSWNHIRLTESDTNSASRVLLKFIFQEMIEEIGIADLRAMLADPVIKSSIQGMFPVENVTTRDGDHIRFAINFFTAIGLGILTEEMRLVLQHLPPDRGRLRSPSRSRSRSFSRSVSYSRSRSGSTRSYSRSRSRSRLFSRSPERSRLPSPHAKRQRTLGPSDISG